jgi:hypothetical protein
MFGFRDALVSTCESSTAKQALERTRTQENSKSCFLSFPTKGGKVTERASSSVPNGYRFGNHGSGPGWRGRYQAIFQAVKGGKLILSACSFPVVFNVPRHWLHGRS